MILFAGLLLTAVFIATVGYRVHAAVAAQNITGLLYNPVLYLFFFVYFYMVLGTMLSPAGQSLVGFVFYDEASDQASWLCYYYFVVTLLCYWISRDRQLRYADIELGAMGELTLGLSLIALPYAYFLLITQGPALAELQSSRYAAMQYYAEAFSQKGFGQTYCIAMAAATLYTLRFPRDPKAVLVVLVCIFPFLAADYLQNARSTMFGIMTLVFILLCTRQQKLYVMPAVAAIVALMLFGLVFRTDYRSLSLGTNLLSSLSELFLTRASVDYVVGSNPDVGLYHLFTASMDRILPGLAKVLDDSNVEYFTDYIEHTMKLSFGLAGNLVSEAYYYGGLPFALISPVLIGGLYLWLSY
ncbi:MAG: hypothetical protein VW625_07630, partial [Perlucidibaca sp.]